ncbi:MAG: SUMF1/EgtB/PvdO family nonheme iron enzyme [Planctomycetota bacterium]
MTLPVRPPAGRARPSVGVEPNPFGLHHMSGNVWEWCLDFFDDYRGKLAPGDGQLLSDNASNMHTLRGGSFAFTGLEARSAYRYPATPGYIAGDAGLRPARRLDIERP